MLDGYWQLNRLKTDIASIDAVIGAAQFAASASNIAQLLGSGGLSQAIAVVGAAAIGFKADKTGLLNHAEASLQANSLHASHERKVEEWTLQRGVAEQDKLIADAQEQLAKDHTAIVEEEEKIAKLQQDQAKATVEFLDNQFTNTELMNG